MEEVQPQVGGGAASGWRRSSLRLEKEQPQVGGGGSASGWRRSSSLRLEKKQQSQVGVGAASGWGKSSLRLGQGQLLVEAESSHRVEE